MRKAEFYDRHFENDRKPEIDEICKYSDNHEWLVNQGPFFYAYILSTSKNLSAIEIAKRVQMIYSLEVLDACIYVEKAINSVLEDFGISARKDWSFIEVYSKQLGKVIREIEKNGSH